MAARKPAERGSPRAEGLSEDGLRDRIEQEIGPFVSQEVREGVLERVRQLVVEEHFSGPIAHPRHLKSYEETEPGAANRIITMAEIQQQHLIDTERTALHAEIADRKVGMYFGFVAFFGLLACATVFGFLGQTVLSGLFLTAATLGAVRRFVEGRPLK